MIEPDDPVSRRYRELAREEPSAALDAAILARGRAPNLAGGVRPRTSRWMGPVSIAAVLVLGIGVALRMQLEQPGIETSVPSSPPSEYSTGDSSAEQAPARPPSPPPQEQARQQQPPQPQPKIQARVEADASPPEKALAKRRDAQVGARREEFEVKRNAAPRPEPNPFADGPVVMQQAPLATTTPATVPAIPAPAPAPSAGAVGSAMAPAAPALRAKREVGSTDTASGARELRGKKDAAADPDPNRELERIALLREAGRHAEADRALEELRRRHPEFRIPDAVWERVKPR